MTNNNNINTNNANVKEETTMKNIGIIVDSKVMAAYSKQFPGHVVATYANKIGVPVITALKGGSVAAKSDNVKFDIVKTAEGSVISLGSFIRLQNWYQNLTQGKDINLDENTMLISCLSFQASAIKQMLEKKGYNVEYDCVDGITISGAVHYRNVYDTATAIVNKSRFLTVKGASVFGAKTYRLRDGRVVDYYREGQHVSAILLPNKETTFDVNGTFFETRGVIVRDNTVKAIIYLLVMANTRNKAIARVNAWATTMWGTGAFLSIDENKIPVGYLGNQPCCKLLENKTNKNAMTVLKEAYRTNDNKCLYAEVSTEHTVTPQSDDINDKIKAAVAVLQQQIDALKIENKNLKAEIKVMSSKLAAIVGVPAEPTADKVEEPAVKEEPEISTPDIKQEDKPEGNDDPKDPTPENDEPNNKENIEEDPYAEFEGMDFDEAEIVVESAFKGKDISDIKEENLEEIELVPDMPAGTVKSKRTVKKENTAQVSLFDEPAKKDIPVLTETKAEEKPAITVDEETINKITDFADVPRVSFPNQYVYPGDYEKAVAEREARIQAALSAVKVLDVDLQTMVKMTIKLRPNNTCTFRDIKVENNKVFVKTETNGQWQHLTIVSNGRRNVLKLNA